jgi:hypothetical protein
VKPSVVGDSPRTLEWYQAQECRVRAYTPTVDRWRNDGSDEPLDPAAIENLHLAIESLVQLGLVLTKPERYVLLGWSGKYADADRIRRRLTRNRGEWLAIIRDGDTPPIRELTLNDDGWDIAGRELTRADAAEWTFPPDHFGPGGYQEIETALRVYMAANGITADEMTTEALEGIRQRMVESYESETVPGAPATYPTGLYQTTNEDVRRANLRKVGKLGGQEPKVTDWQRLRAFDGGVGEWLTELARRNSIYDAFLRLFPEAKGLRGEQRQSAARAAYQRVRANRAPQANLGWKRLPGLSPSGKGSFAGVLPGWVPASDHWGRLSFYQRYGGQDRFKNKWSPPPLAEPYLLGWLPSQGVQTRQSPDLEDTDRELRKQFKPPLFPWEAWIGDECGYGRSEEEARLALARKLHPLLGPWAPEPAAEKDLSTMDRQALIWSRPEWSDGRPAEKWIAQRRTKAPDRKKKDQFRKTELGLPVVRLCPGPPTSESVWSQIPGVGYVLRRGECWASAAEHNRLLPKPEPPQWQPILDSYAQASTPETGVVSL